MMMPLSTHVVIGVMLFFGLSHLGSPLKIEVTTQYQDDVIPTAFNIRCVPDSEASCPKAIVLLKVSRGDGQTIATIQGHDRIYYDSLLKSSVTAEGHIDEMMNKTFFSVTLNGALREDSGTYTCALHYINDNGAVSQMTASYNLTVSDQNTQDVLRHVLFKLSLLQSVVNFQQEKLDQQEIEAEEKNIKLNILEEKLATLGTTLQENNRSVTSELTSLDVMATTLMTTVQGQGRVIQELVQNTSTSVAFSYSYTGNASKVGEVIKFPKKIMDFGNNYDPQTGIFTSPKQGLYVFHISLADDAKNRVDLKVNDVTVITLNLFLEKLEQSSVSTVVPLKVGDQVKPVLHYRSFGNYFHVAEYSHNVFMGYYLRPF